MVFVFITFIFFFFLVFRRIKMLAFIFCFNIQIRIEIPKNQGHLELYSYSVVKNYNIRFNSIVNRRKATEIVSGRLKIARGIHMLSPAALVNPPALIAGNLYVRFGTKRFSCKCLTISDWQKTRRVLFAVIYRVRTFSDCSHFSGVPCKSVKNDICDR